MYYRQITGPTVRILTAPLFYTVITYVLVIANVVHGGRMLTLFAPEAIRIAYALQAAISVAFIGVAVMRGHLIVAFTGLAIIAYLLFAHLVFVMKSGFPANFNAIFGYVPLLAFVPLVEIKLPPRTILKIILNVSAAYTLFYVAMSGYIVANYEPNAALVLQGHDGQGNRLYLAGIYSLFVGFAALKARSMNFMLRLVLFGLAVAAILMSGTRAFLAMAALIFAMSILTPMNTIIRTGIFAGIAAGMALMLFGVFEPGWNPFILFGGDDSAATRAHEYEVAIYALQRNWGFGVGIPTDMDSLQLFLHTPQYQPLFSSDLGVIGPFFDLGLVGLFGFVGAVAYAVLARPAYNDPYVHALHLVCITGALDALISPVLLFDPGAIMLMMLIALRIRRHRQIEALTAEPRRFGLFVGFVTWRARGGFFGSGKSGAKSGS